MSELETIKIPLQSLSSHEEIPAKKYERKEEKKKMLF
jgi:hypothetical protein